MFITIRITRFKINVTLIIQNKRMENRSQKSQNRIGKINFDNFVCQYKDKNKTFYTILKFHRLEHCLLRYVHLLLIKILTYWPTFDTLVNSVTTFLNQPLNPHTYDQGVAKMFYVNQDFYLHFYNSMFFFKISTLRVVKILVPPPYF